MSLRDTMRSAFARPKQPPRESWDRAVASPKEKATAVAERETQLRELDRQKAESFTEDVNKERQRLALEHPEPVLTPDKTKPGMTAWQIENQAHKNVQAKNEAQRQEIRQKPLHRLLTDAREREARQDRDAQQRDVPGVADFSSARPDGERLIGTDEIRQSEVETAQLVEVEISPEIAHAQENAETPILSPNEQRQAELDAMRAEMEARDHDDRDPGHDWDR